jgi:hypothetical protein
VTVETNQPLHVRARQDRRRGPPRVGHGEHRERGPSGASIATAPGPDGGPRLPREPRWPAFGSSATTDGVMRLPSAFSSTVG